MNRVATWRALVVAGLAMMVSACGRGNSTAIAPATAPSAAAPLRNEIPPAVLEQALAAHLEGLGHMERYVEYPQAVVKFREVHKLAPGHIPSTINLAIALLNAGGSEAEEAKEAEEEKAQAKPAEKGEARSNFDVALELLAGVIEREPRNPYAHYCRGIILEYLGQLQPAYEAFKAVSEIDPNDAHTWYKLGSTLTSKADPNRPAGPPESAELVGYYTKALELNPYLVPALYKLQMAYAWDRKPEKQKELLELWKQLNPKQNASAPGEPAETVYGEMGRYARIIDWSPRRREAATATGASPPRFEVPSRIEVKLAEGERWARAEDFQHDGPLGVIGRAHARFGPGITTLDVDGDGHLDLFLACGIRTPKGPRDALLLNRGDGRFEDASARLGPERASIGAAAGDFDADGRVDLFLTGVGDSRLLRNEGDRFEDVTTTAGLGELTGLALQARWLDLDQDGDLDLFVVRYTASDTAEGAFRGGAERPAGVACAVYRNDGKPAEIKGRPQPTWSPRAVAPKDLPAESGLSLAFTAWPVEAAPSGPPANYTGVAWLDVDNDRDLDLVLCADGSAPVVCLNDRLGRFRNEVVADLQSPTAGPLQGLLVLDIDRDGRSDLVAVAGPGRLGAWRNRVPEAASARRYAFEYHAIDASDWASAQAVDLDLDGAFDLVGLASGANPAAVGWSRNTGSGFQTVPLALGPDGTAALRGVWMADLTGDPLPELLIWRDGEAPAIARNLGNGNHWLALDLAGRWKFSFDRMRTNVHGLGALLRLQGLGLDVVYPHNTPESGLGQAVGPIVLGLGRSASVDLVRVAWPDGVLQCELNQAADQVRDLAEYNRKTGSCPVLFTYDGDRFVCIGDFLGGGGLGYLVAPGVYGEPDRDEAVGIAGEQLAAVGGVFRLSVTEPMDEVAYLDRLTLDVVDRPPGVQAAPEERFAPGGNRPSGRLVAWRRRIEPVKATDHEGRDLTETLRTTDRRTADEFQRLGAWVGYTEPHAIVLDFGDRLSALKAEERVYLALQGWVEYPYSQTNYAAATAGTALQPPVLERQREDGTWEVLEADPGYPAGLPRLTLLELTGKLGGPHCVLRLRTNMECYWDEAFVAVEELGAGVRVQSLDVSRAELGARGYTREVSPDGKQPLLYDYDYIDPAPLAWLEGQLTRYGDVAPLLRLDDDQLCIVGPGDEVRLEFDARSLPALPEGWSRSYVLRSAGYCKDADPFTAASDTVGPLPWRGMGAYPFGKVGERPRDEAYERYLRTYQTREVGGR